MNIVADALMANNKFDTATSASIVNVDLQLRLYKCIKVGLSNQVSDAFKSIYFVLADKLFNRNLP